MKSDVIKIYTDGACSNNPGPGGWGVIVCKGDSIIKMNGGKKETTNNQMELTAIINALEFILNDDGSNYQILSDSSYCVNTFNLGWLKGWKKNGWLTSSGNKIKNEELWKVADELFSKILEIRYKAITFIKVKGHSGVCMNEEADELARMGILKDEDLNE